MHDGRDLCRDHWTLVGMLYSAHAHTPIRCLNKSLCTVACTNPTLDPNCYSLPLLPWSRWLWSWWSPCAAPLPPKRS